MGPGYSLAVQVPAWQAQSAEFVSWYQKQTKTTTTTKYNL